MKGEAAAVDRLESCSRTAVFIPQPVVAELRYGLTRMAKSKRKAMLEERLELILGELPRASWDDEVSRQFGTAKAMLERSGQRLEDFDLAIASHALAAKGILVTSNSKHMSRLPGLELEDWGT